MADDSGENDCEGAGEAVGESEGVMEGGAGGKVDGGETGSCDGGDAGAMLENVVDCIGNDIDTCAGSTKNYQCLCVFSAKAC